MKILYLTMAERDETSGVYKKIMAQADALRRLGHMCDLLFVRDSRMAEWVRADGAESVDLDAPSVMEKVAAFLKECDVCYARFELLRHRYYAGILRLCRQTDTDVIVEIPTYPPHQESLARVREKVRAGNYFGAGKTLVGALLVMADVYRLAMRAKLMCIVADDKQFAFTKTVRIENGIDIAKNPFSQAPRDEMLRMVAVSNFAVWNGYDRAIEGLKQYVETTGRRDIVLSLVGDERKGADLVALTEQYHLEDMVRFTGALSGKALDDAYAAAHVGLGALGNHRRKVFANSSLKAKEYAARGLVMVLSDAEGIEQEIREKAFIVKSDETPVDFVAVRHWYDAMTDYDGTKKYIREYAAAHYSWDVQMRKVMNAYAQL